MTREEAINLIDINRSNLKATNEEGFSKDIEALNKAIKALEKEKGYWNHSIDREGFHVWDCSNCMFGIKTDKDYLDFYYCPNCGAKMEGEEV